MNLKICCCHSGAKSQITNNISSFVSKILSSMFLVFIGIYRSVFTAHFGAGVCRFEPSCSAYANEAFLKHSFLKAFKLSTLRVLKCRPGSTFGFDPVPANEAKA